MLKRLMMAAAIVVIAVSAGAATARADEKGETSEQTVIKSRTFTIAKGQCSQLPGNVEIQGLGLERTTTRIEGRDDPGEDEGRVSLSGSLLSRITGTATDLIGVFAQYEKRSSGSALVVATCNTVSFVKCSYASSHQMASRISPATLLNHSSRTSLMFRRSRSRRSNVGYCHAQSETLRLRNGTATA